MKELGNKIEGFIASKAIENKKSIFENRGLKGFSNEILKSEGINIRNEAVGGKELGDLRGRLNNDPGLIIANHPGPSPIDVVAVTAQIERKDVKVVLSSNAFEIFSHAIDPKILFPLPKDKRGAPPSFYKNYFGEILDYIKAGHAVALFPTGGAERKKEKFLFQRGFRSIVKRLRPDDMIYSFYLFGPDLPELREQQGRIKASLALQSVFNSELRLDPQKRRHDLVLKECYSTAKDWQGLIAGGKPEDEMSLLTKHYLEQFK
ncbi:MAG: hypothetical protein M1383_03875 [Patescibacteria group bacterium]|nr:hypothetical protein [Patescibacteria group bacterium]